MRLLHMRAESSGIGIFSTAQQFVRYRRAVVYRAGLDLVIDLKVDCSPVTAIHI